MTKSIFSGLFAIKAFICMLKYLKQNDFITPNAEYKEIIPFNTINILIKIWIMLVVMRSAYGMGALIDVKLNKL